MATNGSTVNRRSNSSRAPGDSGPHHDGSVAPHELQELLCRVRAKDRCSPLTGLQAVETLLQSCHPLPIAVGNQGMILVFHDLTRLKQLENTRQEFVANVSHELRRHSP